VGLWDNHLGPTRSLRRSWHTTIERREHSGDEHAILSNTYIVVEGRQGLGVVAATRIAAYSIEQGSNLDAGKSDAVKIPQPLTEAQVAAATQLSLVQKPV